MIKPFAVLICLMSPAAAYAFTGCTTSELAGPDAYVAEEDSNPVTSGMYVHAGYTLGGSVAVATSSDGGLTLGNPAAVYKGAGTATGLRLATSYAHAYAQWTQRDGYGNHVMFAASRNHGGTWGPAIVLGDHQGGVLTQIAADGSNVHAVFFQADGSLMVTSSTNGGQSFSPSVKIDSCCSEVFVISQGQNVYVTWDGISSGQLLAKLAVSHDDGNTFSVQNLSDTNPGEPILALDRISGRLSAAWREGSPPHGVYRQSLDNGDHWSTPLILDSPARDFMAADDGKYIYVSYLKRFEVNGAYDFHVYLAISSDGGHSFPAGTDLSGETGIHELHDDNERPIPWAWEGKETLRVTGIEADGAHIWSAKHGHLLNPAYLGHGVDASPARNSVVWEGPNTTVMYGVCS